MCAPFPAKLASHKEQRLIWPVSSRNAVIDQVAERRVLQRRCHTLLVKELLINLVLLVVGAGLDLYVYLEALGQRPLEFRLDGEPDKGGNAASWHCRRETHMHACFVDPN